ncbi:MAG: hypothetical protein H7Y22_06885 [Gemmatimonadaceae bacterium]|nr:hypothetical protein [Gloeobacterales cyanobacterium ES-bin-141]
MNPIKTPEMLSLSVERLFLSVTEPLDPFVGLKLLQIVQGLVDIAYTMGHHDGGGGAHAAQPCSECPFAGVPPFSG